MSTDLEGAGEVRPEPGTAVRTRRAVLAAGLGAVAGWAAGALGRPEPVDAAAGGTMKLGVTNSAGTATTKVSSRGTSNSLFGNQTAGGIGVRGESTSGTGVLGTAKASNRIGVRGRNTAATPGGGAGVSAEGGQNHGLLATTANSAADAIRATNSAASGTGVRAGGFVAVDGSSPTAGGTGVRGENVSSGGGSANTGVEGTVAGAGAIGVKGTNPVVTGGGIGVVGDSAGATGVGVLGSGTGASGIGVQGSGVIGVSSIGTLTVAGNATVSGVVSAAAIVAGTKSFRIDHPVDPVNRYLAHACVESDERRNVYDGTITLDPSGAATVDLPSWFEALNSDVRYQLTAIGAAMPELHVARLVKDGAFAIAGGKPGGTVSWQLTGVRRDAYAKANPLAVDTPKKGREKGRYLHPEAFGADPAESIGALTMPAAARR